MHESRGGAEGKERISSRPPPLIGEPDAGVDAGLNLTTLRL